MISVLMSGRDFVRSEIIVLPGKYRPESRFGLAFGVAEIEKLRGRQVHAVEI